MLVVVSVVAQAQLDRIDRQLMRQLVERRFQREAARPLARRTCRVVLRRVDPHEAVRGRHVGAGWEHARDRRDGIGVLAVGRGLSDRVMHDAGSDGRRGSRPA